jgi:serine phosphatase RsbU (regulator of sigma subunit)
VSDKHRPQGGDESKIDEPAIDDPGPDEGSPAKLPPKKIRKRDRDNGAKERASSAVEKIEGDKGATETAKLRGLKGKKKKAEKEDEALELEPISPFKRGISIGIKFAALTAIVVAASMVLLGTLAYSITSQQVNDQINQGGVEAVATLEKGVDRIYWKKPEKLIDDIYTQMHGEPPPKLDDSLNDVAKEQNQRLYKTYQQSAQAIWDNIKLASQESLKARLKGLVEGSNNQILAAAVYNKTGGVVDAVAAYPETFKVNTKFVVKLGTVDVSEGRMADTGLLLRQFERPITDDGAAISDAAVSVWISAKKIEDVETDVFNRLMLVTAMGALAGVILTAVVAAVLSRPIRALEGDISEVAEGNLEHETVVRSHDEIGALAHTFNIMTRNVRAAQSHAVERKAIERELSIATEIQTKLLPERIPQIPGLDIHSFYLSAKEVGGDYYDFIVIDQTHLGIIVADVSGKGIPGSMVMTMARSLVRLASVRNVSPADTFKKVNRILAKDIRRGMFVTSIYMVLNVKTHELKVASAGHNPLVVFRAESGQNELIKPQGIALGFDKGTIFDNHIQEMEIQLKPGDRICAYTDGVNEAMNAESEEFGDDRFYNLVKQHARLSSKDFVQKIVDELKAHRGEAEQSDDITITTLAVIK